MSMPDDSRQPLTQGDRRFLAAALAVALIAAASWWWAAGGPRGDLVEIDVEIDEIDQIVEIDDAPKASPAPARFKVDINLAGWPELAQLPGVGETMARRIVAYREQAGPFAQHDDLCRVHGVGPKLLARVRPYLRPVTRPESVVAR